MVTTLHKLVHLRFAKRVSVKVLTPHPHVTMQGDGVLINLIVATISQRICISNHHVTYLKHIQFLFVNYASIKLGKIKIIVKKNTGSLCAE